MRFGDMCDYVVNTYFTIHTKLEYTHNYYYQEHMTEGASNGGNHSSCKFAEHDLIWKTAK